MVWFSHFISKNWQKNSLSTYQDIYFKNLSLFSMPSFHFLSKLCPDKFFSSNFWGNIYNRNFFLSNSSKEIGKRNRKWRKTSDLSHFTRKKNLQIEKGRKIFLLAVFWAVSKRLFHYLSENYPEKNFFAYFSHNFFIFYRKFGRGNFLPRIIRNKYWKSIEKWRTHLFFGKLLAIKEKSCIEKWKKILLRAIFREKWKNRFENCE